MAWFTPVWAPGVNTLDKGLANEGGYSLSNLMRFLLGGAQPIGGWTPHTTKEHDGPARDAKPWRTIEGKKVVCFGTPTHLYGRVDGRQRDITPYLQWTVLNNAFTTRNGDDIVDVRVPYHRFRVGNAVTFANHQTTVGGLTIEGDYEVVSVLDENRFTIEHASAASSAVTDGGGLVDFRALLPAGLASNPLTGYGIGTYGSGAWGTGPEDLDTMRDWSIFPYGEFGLINPSGYGIFEWQPEIDYPELAFNGDFASSDGWALGTGWAISAGKATKTSGTASNLSQDFEGVLVGGKTFRVKFTVSGRSAGTLKFRINAGDTPAVIDVGAASSAISKNGSYDRIFLCPAVPLDIVFEADNAFNGSIDDVEITLLDLAYRIETAPPRVESMFVDPRGLVVALGTTLLDGSYSAIHYRCSDLGNNRLWIPDTDNLASEYPIQGIGGVLRQGINTSEQNLVGGDEGVASMQYLGEPGNAFRVTVLGTGCGLMSRHSFAASGGFVFWISNTKQFYMFRGVSIGSLGKPEIIVCPVEAEVFDNIPARLEMKVHTGINTRYAEAWFFFPDKRDSGEECSRIATVSWTQMSQDGGIPWALHQLGRSAWVPPGIFSAPLGFTTNPGNNYIYEHETGTKAAGAGMGWYIETASFDAGDGETLAIIDEAICQLSEQSGSLRIILKHRDDPREDWTETVLTNPDGDAYLGPLDSYLYCEVKAREFAVRIEEFTDGAFARIAPGNLRLNLIQTSAHH